jgi:hypothetical protein
MKKTALFIVLPLFAFLFAGCMKTATYDEAAYNETLDLKQETLNLMDKATEPYASHESEVDALLARLDQAYASSKQRADNETTTKQWELLLDKEANLVGGFFKRWKDSGKLSKFFVDEAKNLIAKAFDTITELEEGKKK